MCVTNDALPTFGETNKASRFKNSEKTSLREKYLLSLGVPLNDIPKIEAMLNGMYNLGKRHAYDETEVSDYV